MKRIEVKLSLPFVAPLLDIIRATAAELDGAPVASPPVAGLDEELCAALQGELLQERREGCRRFLALFDREFFANGVVGFDDTNAESVLRICSALRIHLRAHRLKSLPDEIMESGQVNVDRLDEPVRKAYLGYIFLAMLQELIIQHLDATILGADGR